MPHHTDALREEHSYPQLHDFLLTEKAHKLFDRTLAHPELSECIAWAPVTWLVEIANPHPLSDTTMDNADGNGHRRATLDELYSSMLGDGMRDPLVLGIGKDGYVRLETGNQRVRTLLDADVAFAPVVGMLGSTSITNTSNGMHRGHRMNVRPFEPASYHMIVRPDEYLPEMIQVAQ